MVKEIKGPACTVHARAGELGAVLVTGRSGQKAGIVNVRIGDDPATVVRQLQEWLGFGAGQERKIVKAVMELRK